MKVTRQFARRFRLLTLLRTILGLGGALARPDVGGLWTLAGIDLAFAVAIAAAWLPLRV